MRRWSYYEIRPESRRAPTSEDWEWFEEELAGPLPHDYRGFLRSYGWTGFAREMRFPLDEASPWGSSAEVCCFFGFSSEVTRDLGYLTTETYGGLLPNDTIPIGCDGNGSLLLLSFAGPSRGKVWFWDRECRGLDDEIDEMVAALEDRGVDTLELDEHGILRRWEELFPDRRWRPAGFANVYAVADSFTGFLRSLYPARAPMSDPSGLPFRPR